VYATIALFPLTILSGWLSDRIGRKPVIVSGLILGAAFTLPAFYLLQEIGGKADSASANQSIFIVIILIGLSAILALVVGPQTALLAELFPAKTRNSAATLPHNLAAGWIGGLLPLIVTWLNREWASDVAGLCYPTIILATSGVVALLYLPETKNINLSQE
jgi:MFS family permease